MGRLLIGSFAAASALALASCAGPSARLRADDRPPAMTEPAPTPEEVSERVERVIALHNEERAKAKLHSLEVSPRLARAAQRHAEDMAKTRRMSHEGSDNSSPFDRIKKAGYVYRRAGENVAFGRWSPERLVSGWMGSPPHKKNILGNYSQIGVACAIAEDGTAYWCATFGLPLRD